MQQYGQDLESLEPNKYLGEFPLSESYFTVYDNNAGAIGSIPDEALRNQIVRTYIRAKGMVDSIRLYNNLLSKAQVYSGSFRVGSNEATVSTRRWTEVRSYAQALKSLHMALKAEVVLLQQELERNGIKWR